MALPNIASVVAEDAPIGVQLWPTIHPDFAPNFTLERVEITRTCVGTNVRWYYQNNTERVFRLGETVAVDGDALGEWMSDGYRAVGA